MPLVKEIDVKNDKLRRTGHGDSLIGRTALQCGIFNLAHFIDID